MLGRRLLVGYHVTVGSYGKVGVGSDEPTIDGSVGRVVFVGRRVLLGNLVSVRGRFN